jgi:hypothetical protein
LTLCVSQEVIGQGVNGTRESTAKVLKILRNAGLIAIEYRRTTVLSLEGLAGYARGETE